MADLTYAQSALEVNVVDNGGALETGGNLALNAAANAASLEFNQLILLELRAIRLALVALATDGGKYQADDFNPQKNDFSDSGSGTLN